MNPIEWWLDSMPAPFIDQIIWVLKTIVALPLIVLGLWLIIRKTMQLIRWSRDTAKWRSDRQPCTHCGEFTLHISNGTFAGCEHGKPCCPGCMLDHKTRTEPLLTCPVDQRPMEKIIDHAKGLVGACCVNGHALVGIDLDVVDALELDQHMRH